MDLTVRYAKFDELPRVNELRRAVSELHAEGRPDIFRPGFCEELQQRVYTLFDASQYDVIVACLDGEICGFAIVQYVDHPGSAYMRPGVSITLKNSEQTKNAVGMASARLFSLFARQRLNAKALTGWRWMSGHSMRTHGNSTPPPISGSTAAIWNVKYK